MEYDDGVDAVLRHIRVPGGERVLVTGAAGFIGSHTVARLLADGWAVTGLDNFDPFYDRALKEEGLRPLLDHPRFTFREGDIRRPADVDAALTRVDAVVHLAARAGVRPSIEDPEAYTSINVGGTATLLEACRRVGIRRFVFGSSSSVYGDSTPVPFRESAPCAAPISPYAVTKRAGELQCAVYAHLHGFRVAALRFFTVYGPRQRPDLAIHRFTRLLSNGEAIPRYGDGSSERDYTFVDDIVAGVRAAVGWTRTPVPGFELFNLGGNRTVRLDALIQLIARALDVEPRIRRLPSVPGDVQRTCADIERSRRVLRYHPVVDIEEGIRRFVTWYRRHPAGNAEPTMSRPAADCIVTAC